jgi:hypothetical protein
MNPYAVLQKLRLFQEEVTPIFESSSDVVTSNPPVGKCRVVNLYVDPETKKLIVAYDDTPEGG